MLIKFRKVVILLTLIVNTPSFAYAPTSVDNEVGVDRPRSPIVSPGGIITYRPEHEVSMSRGTERTQLTNRLFARSLSTNLHLNEIGGNKTQFIQDVFERFEQISRRDIDEHIHYLSQNFDSFAAFTLANFAKRDSEVDLVWAFDSLRSINCLNQSVTNSAFFHVVLSDINARQLLLDLTMDEHALRPDQAGSDEMLSLITGKVTTQEDFWPLSHPEEHWSWYTTNIVEPSRDGLIKAYKMLLTNPRETLVLQEMFTRITEKLEQNHRLVMSEWTLENGELHKFEKKGENGRTRDRHLIM